MQINSLLNSTRLEYDYMKYWYWEASIPRMRYTVLGVGTHLG